VSIFKRLGQKIVYRCPWLSITEHEFIGRDDHNSRYYTLDQADSVLIIPVSLTSRRTLLQQQERIPLNEISWEFPLARLRRGRIRRRPHGGNCGRRRASRPTSWWNWGGITACPAYPTKKPSFLSYVKKDNRIQPIKSKIIHVYFIQLYYHKKPHHNIDSYKYLLIFDKCPL
jgi:hypothetical protein